MDKFSSRLWGVGLGPGDPDLVTVKAARVIGRADVIAYHSAQHGRSIARSIAAPYLREGQMEEALVYPVTTETTDHPGGYRAAMEAAPSLSDRSARPGVIAKAEKITTALHAGAVNVFLDTNRIDRAGILRLGPRR